MIIRRSFFIILILSLSLSAYVTDWKEPGTCVNVDRDSKPEWSNPDSAKISDDKYTVCTVGPLLDYGDWLRCTNFGFTTSDIPSGSNIAGIEVEFERKAGGAGVLDNAIYLRKSSGQVGDNKANTDTLWMVIIDENFIYGGPDDDWNSGLTDSDIRDSGFGVDISAACGALSAKDAKIDRVRIRVYYNYGQGPNTPTPIRIFDNAIFNAYPPPYVCTLSVKSVDPEEDSIEYEIQWDKDPNFSTASSETTGIHLSGSTVDTTVLLGSTPSEAETLFYWKSRARDPHGSNNWSSWSVVRSFIMDLEAEDVYWYQTSGTQFNQGTMNNVTVQGDSVILNAGQSDGSLTSPSIVYSNLSSENPDRSHWDGVKWTKSSANDSVGMQIEYKSGGVWNLIPDGDLPGNSTGFFNQSSVFCVQDLSSLDTNTYDTLRIKSMLRRTIGKASNDPVLKMFALGNKGSNITGVSEKNKFLKFYLLGIEPELFSNKTEIRYQLKERINVKLQVFDIIGREVNTLINDIHDVGYYTILWRGTDKNGRPLHSGMYILYMKAGEYETKEKVLILR